LDSFQKVYQNLFSFTSFQKVHTGHWTVTHAS
jgi:hypothetical protein